MIRLSLRFSAGPLLFCKYFKIGIAIGSLVNVVSSNISQNDEALTGASTYMQQIKGPAMNLIKLYLLHCTCTFSYIYSLAIVGNVCL